MLLYEYRAPRRNENRIELRESESQVCSCRQGKWDDGEKSSFVSRLREEQK